MYGKSMLIMRLLAALIVHSIASELSAMPNIYNSCELKTHKPIYNEARVKACGVESEAYVSDKSCGVEAYKSCRSEGNPIEAWVVNGHFDKLNEYQKCLHDLDLENHTSVEGNTGILSCWDNFHPFFDLSVQAKPGELCEKWATQNRIIHIRGADFTRWVITGVRALPIDRYVETTNNDCHKPGRYRCTERTLKRQYVCVSEGNIETPIYKDIPNSECGVSSYKTCSIPRYKLCALPENGIKKYESVQDPDCGVDTKKLNLLSDQEYFETVIFVTRQLISDHSVTNWQNLRFISGWQSASERKISFDVLLKLKSILNSVSLKKTGNSAQDSFNKLFPSNENAIKNLNLHPCCNPE